MAFQVIENLPNSRLYQPKYLSWRSGFVS